MISIYWHGLKWQGNLTGGFAKHCIPSRFVVLRLYWVLIFLSYKIYSFFGLGSSSVDQLVHDASLAVGAKKRRNCVLYYMLRYPNYLIFPCSFSTVHTGFVICHAACPSLCKSWFPILREQADRSSTKGTPRLHVLSSPASWDMGTGAQPHTPTIITTLRRCYYHVPDACTTHPACATCWHGLVLGGETEPDVPIELFRTDYQKCVAQMLDVLRNR
jgi:ferredoxin